MNKKISVCVITYNHEKYIAQCLKSIIAQDYADFQIVISDDCSTDKTVDVIRHISQLYPDKIKLIAREKNVGAGRNLHEALMSCDGDYIALCEGDDFWLSFSKLSSQVSMLVQNPDVDVCFHPVVRVSEDGKFINRFNGCEIPFIPSSEVIRKGGGSMPTCSIFFRASVLRNCADWISEAPVGDYFYQAIAASRGGALCEPTTLGAYRVNSVSSRTQSESISGKRLNYVKGMHASLNKLNDSLNGKFMSEIKFRFKKLCFWNFKYCIYNRRYSEAFSVFAYWLFNDVG